MHFLTNIQTKIANFPMLIFRQLLRNHRFQSVVAWVVSTLLFSFLYWMAWIEAPDAFILNKEFNLTPYEHLQSKLWGQDRYEMWNTSSNPPPTSVTDIEEYSKKVEAIDREATFAQVQLGHLRSEQSRLEAAEKAIYEKHSAKLWSNIERYKNEAVKDQQVKVSAAQADVDAISIFAQGSASLGVALTLANAKVQLAQAEYALSVRQLAAAEYVLHNLRSLSDPSTTALLDATSASLLDISKRQGEISSHLRDVREQAFASLKDWYSARTSRLEWIDFLYFSVGVSTTTTFGDIVPNSRRVRVIALIQLVVSVLVVGYLVSLLSVPHRATNGERLVSRARVRSQRGRGKRKGQRV